MTQLDPKRQILRLLTLRVHVLIELGDVEAARPLAEKIFATGRRDPDLEAICRRHGLPAGSTDAESARLPP